MKVVFVIQVALAALNLTLALNGGSNSTWFFAGFCVALAFSAALNVVFDR